ncbi:MAG: hypothetical protein AB1696_10660 [Planctomycetota bacterium]
MSSGNKTRKATSVCDRLSKKFRMPPIPHDVIPVEALLMAILMERVSQECAEQVVKRFKSAFVDWNEMRVTTGREIAECAREKQIDQRIARACRDALDKLYTSRGAFDLSNLADESFTAMRDYLLGELRLAPSAAARLMLLFFNRPALPLSEDVRRVADRIGLTDPSWPYERAQKYLERLIPNDRIGEFYHCLTHHAETTCLVSNPKCSRCPVRTLCDYYARMSKGTRGTTARKTPASSKAKKKAARKASTKKKS